MANTQASDLSIESRVQPALKSFLVPDFLSTQSSTDSSTHQGPEARGQTAFFFWFDISGCLYLLLWVEEVPFYSFPADIFTFLILEKSKLNTWHPVREKFHFASCVYVNL